MIYVWWIRQMGQMTGVCVVGKCYLNLNSRIQHIRHHIVIHWLRKRNFQLKLYVFGSVSNLTHKLVQFKC